MTARDFSRDEHRKMNMAPEIFIRVPHEAMKEFVAEVGSAAGLDDEKASLLARLLTENDLRGTFSHGTESIAKYAPALRDGAINRSPEVRVMRETPVSIIVDGDGGLGYFPAYEGTRRAIEKAKAHGMAVMVSQNHGHIGAAGIYTRMTLEHDLLTMVTGGHSWTCNRANPCMRLPWDHRPLSVRRVVRRTLSCWTSGPSTTFGPRPITLRLWTGCRGLSFDV